MVCSPRAPLAPSTGLTTAFLFHSRNYRKATQLIDRPMPSRAQQILTLLVESAALYSFLWVRSPAVAAHRHVRTRSPPSSSTQLALIVGEYIRIPGLSSLVTDMFMPTYTHIAVSAPAPSPIRSPRRYDTHARAMTTLPGHLPDSHHRPGQNESLTMRERCVHQNDAAHAVCLPRPFCADRRHAPASQSSHNLLQQRRPGAQ